MMIETKRLRIIALTIESFGLLLRGVDKMEQVLALTPSDEHFDEPTQQAMEGLYQEALKHQDNYWWYTNWLIVLKAENKAIGSACFIREPNENGEVEIGYGINAGYRNQGYMTETVQAMCAWALRQHNVRYIIAETERDNHASHKVLLKCGMCKDHESGNSFWWRLSRG